MGCGWDGLIPNGQAKRNAAPIELPPVSTITLEDVPEPVATALSDTTHVESVVSKVLEEVKSQQTSPVKIVNLADLDLSLIEKPRVVKSIRKEDLVK